MHRTMLRLSLISLVLFAPLAVAQEVPGVFLRHARVEAEAQHDALWSLDMRAARAQYRSLTPEMMADVWTIHLERFLLDHPNLTPEQRAVVTDALDLVSTGVVEANLAFDHASPVWETTVHQPIVQLEQRAIAAFGREQERELLELMGSDRTAPVSSKTPRRFVVSTNEACDCSTLSSTCNCVPRRFSGCFFTPGCGPLGNEGCNGLCS